MNEEKEDPILAAPNPNENIEEIKPTLTFDQRQTLLFNNPNYAVVLCFLEHFRSLFDFEDYPLTQFEENLLNDQENISRHLIDFHFALLKRISLGKGAKREKFLSIITKFAERFDWNDGESLKTNGYARADIDLKIRILKNLVECQFDLNPTFKSALLEKPSFEVRSQAFGRDRSGAFYWLFMDRECFIRIFRENVDDDRSWSFIAKDKDELEKFIILLITDHVVRKKFVDWKFVHEPFNLLPTSKEFEEKFCPPAPIAVKDEVVSDHESVASVDTNAHGSSQEEKPEINNNQEDRKMKKKKKGRGRRKSIQRKKVKKEVSTPVAPSPPKTTKEVKPPAPVSPSPPKEVKPPPPISTPELPLDDDSLNNDLPIALRRSRRVRKVPTTELPSVKSTPVKTPTPTPTKKKVVKGKIRQEKKVKMKSKKKKNTTASSDDEEIEPSDDDEEYNSDDYLPDPKQIDELADDDLLEEEIEDDDEYVPRRSAKTVAKRRGQLTNGNLDEVAGPSSACCICSKTDRPEALLLCDDCDDAYHLECLKPALIAVPDGDWFCPLCEHKRFAEKLIDKYLQLIKDLQELELKKTQCISKRTNRLANVMLNLDKMVKKRRGNGIVDSDEEEEEEAAEEEEEEEEEEQDNDSVYRFKDEKSERKPKRKYEEKVEDLGVRSCRRKPQNYRFDDYDKKMKEAMLEAGASGDETDEESNEDNEPTTTKKRAGYDEDDDFNASKNKNDDEFAPDAERSDESESEEAQEEDFDDEESSDGGWKSKRRSSTKRKQPTRSTRRRAKIKSEDDDESGSEFEIDDIDDRRRSSRTTTAPKNYAKQDESPDDDDDDVDDDEEMRRPPPKRIRNRKRLGSDDSFLGDDDYERLARKREIFEYHKTTGPRATITDRIKQLVEEEKVSTENNEKPTETIEKPSESVEKKAEDQPSDDDDFPDEQEIFKSKSLINLKTNFNGPTPMGFRPPLLTSTHSYQHAIVDPTARFAMIRPPGQTATGIPLARTPMNNVYPSNGYPN